MGREISEEELKRAKEKLACHIEPQTFSTGASGGASSSGGAAGSAPSTGGASSGASASASVPQDSFIGPDGQVFLTRMTTAGG